MNAFGVIFSHIQNENIDALARKRTVASVPFGGRYRLIDFALSNIVSAGIVNVGVIAQKNYQSLMDHVGSGKDWDLSRRNGGLLVFPPFGNYKSDFLYGNRLSSLKSIIGYLTKVKEDVAVLMDCDSVNTVDLTDAIEQHLANNADITMVYVKDKNYDLIDHLQLETDENNRVTKAAIYKEEKEDAKVGINIWIINRRLLLSLIDDAIQYNQESFEQDIIMKNYKTLKIYGYEYKGIYMHISSMENYFKNNMSLLDYNVRKSLFQQDNHRIYTKVRDSTPTRYGMDAKVENSFIADGCEIEGKVVNSILFRGVKVGKGTVIKNSILMQDTIIGNNVKLNCVITDKNVTIRDRNDLAGCEKLPYYLSKNTMV